MDRRKASPLPACENIAAPVLVRAPNVMPVLLFGSKPRFLASVVIARFFVDTMANAKVVKPRNFLLDLTGYGRFLICQAQREGINLVVQQVAEHFPNADRSGLLKVLHIQSLRFAGSRSASFKSAPVSGEGVFCESSQWSS